MKLLLPLFICCLAMSGCEKDAESSQHEDTTVTTSVADVGETTESSETDTSVSVVDAEFLEDASDDVDVLVFDALVFDVSDAGTDDVE